MASIVIFAGAFQSKNSQLLLVKSTVLLLAELLDVIVLYILISDVKSKDFKLYFIVFLSFDIVLSYVNSIQYVYSHCFEYIHVQLNLYHQWLSVFWVKSIVVQSLFPHKNLTSTISYHAGKSLFVNFTNSSRLRENAISDGAISGYSTPTPTISLFLYGWANSSIHSFSTLQTR